MIDSSSSGRLVPTSSGRFSCHLVPSLRPHLVRLCPATTYERTTPHLVPSPGVWNTPGRTTGAQAELDRTECPATSDGAEDGAEVIL
jgi:hypothetical protein